MEQARFSGTGAGARVRSAGGPTDLFPFYTPPAIPALLWSRAGLSFQRQAMFLAQIPRRQQIGGTPKLGQPQGCCGENAPLSRSHAAGA